MKGGVDLSLHTKGYGRLAGLVEREFGTDFAIDIAEFIASGG